MNGPGDIVVKAHAQHVRDMGLSPTWFQFFSVKKKTGVKGKKDGFMRSHYNMIITSGRIYGITR